MPGTAPSHHAPVTIEARTKAPKPTAPDPAANCQRDRSLPDWISHSRRREKPRPRRRRNRIFGAYPVSRPTP